MLWLNKADILSGFDFGPERGKQFSTKAVHGDTMMSIKLAFRSIFWEIEKSK